VRVRYAAITSLGLFCTELGPELQLKHHKEIIEGLWKVIDHENIKLRTQTVKCLVNFCNGIKDSNESLLEPYAGTLLDKLGKLFEQSLTANFIPFQAEVLCCMSIIATTMRDKFAAYYSTFIPGLKTILNNTPMTTLQQKQLRANTIHTIGNMIYAVSEIEANKEIIINDTKEITIKLISVLDSKLTDDDPQIVAINNFWSQASYVLKESFVEYLSKIIPPLFTYLSADTRMRVTDAQNPAQSDNQNDLVLEFDKIKLSVNSQAFQNKLLAANVLMEMCSNVKKGFRAYTMDMAKAICELFNYTSSKSLKQAGAKSFKYLLETCESKEEMVTLFNHIYPAMKAAIMRDIENETLDHVKFFLKELCNAMRYFIDGPQMLSEGEMITMCGLLEKALLAYRSLHQDKLKYLHDSKKLDEDEIEEVNAEIDKYAKILTHSMEIAGIIEKLYVGQAYAPFISKLIPQYAYFWEHSGDSNRIQLASICFFCDVIEHMHGASFHNELAAQTAKRFLSAMSNEERDIVQSASYGLGLVAQYAQPKFKEILAPALEALLKVVQEPDSRSEDKAVCTECAIGAIGKICLFFYGHELVGASLVQQYLALLPLKAESEEAQNVHKLLFEQVLQKNGALMGNVENVKGALERIHSLATAEPELEILRPADVPLLQQCVTVLTGVN
jgi:hypothetical protein